VRRWNWYYDVFGPDRFLWNCKQHNIKEITDLNKKLLELGARYSSRYVATNDVHYVKSGGRALAGHPARHPDQLHGHDRTRMRMTDDSYFLRSPVEMNQSLAEVPESLSNTLLIADRCSVDLGFKGYHLPEFPGAEGYTTRHISARVCAKEGSRKRYKDDAAVKGQGKT